MRLAEKSRKKGLCNRLAVGISDDPPHSVVKAVTARKDELIRERSSIGRARAKEQHGVVGSSPTVPNKKINVRKEHTMANLNFNRVILGGRLTAAPELKSTQSGTKVTTFTVAVNRRASKDGQQQSDFINCVAWQERAELIVKFFTKGSSILVEGEIQTRTWKDSDGNDRYATEVNVSQVHFVDSKSENPMNNAPSVIPGYQPQTQFGAPKFEEMSSDEDLPF